MGSPYGVGVYGLGPYGIGIGFYPFVTIGKPMWTRNPVTAGNFHPINVANTVNIPEVLFGQGGFGAGGFDSPTINIQATAKPNWKLSYSK